VFDVVYLINLSIIAFSSLMLYVSGAQLRECALAGLGYAVLYSVVWIVDKYSACLLAGLLLGVMLFHYREWLPELIGKIRDLSRFWRGALSDVEE